MATPAHTHLYILNTSPIRTKQLVNWWRGNKSDFFRIESLHTLGLGPLARRSGCKPVEEEFMSGGCLAAQNDLKNSVYL